MWRACRFATRVDADQALRYCLGKRGAYINTPFGAEVVCARIGKRIFAEIYVIKKPAWVTLRCDADRALFDRERFAGHVTRGYHCPIRLQPYSNTVTLDGFIPDDEIMRMIDHSYERCLRSLNKREREEALSGEQA